MLAAVDGRAAEMRRQLRELCEINSGTANVAGVSAVREKLLETLAPLADSVEIIPLPPRKVVDERGDVREQNVADAALLRRRPEAARRVLLCGHLDTVYPADSEFQSITEVDADTWNGPGVADMKGGLVVMAEALRAFERHPAAASLGWTVVLNTDEEIGSPSSTPLLQTLAAGHVAGLVYEPALPTGGFAGDRGGSANYDLVVRGKSAHVGRDFAEGRSAMHAAAEAVGVLASLNAAEGVTVNVGKIDGGGPVNQVADVAVVRFNVRVADAEKQEAITNDLRRLAFVMNRRDGLSCALHGEFLSPPKPLVGETLTLFETARDVGRTLDLDLSWQPTGGVCDGNKLQAAGLPTLDTLGVRGGSLHSFDEFVSLDSLVERAKLSALLLARLASS